MLRRIVGSCLFPAGCFLLVSLGVGEWPGIYRLHRQLPFGATNSVVINEQSSTFLTVAQGLPANPSLDVASIVSHPTGTWYSIPSDYKNAYAEQFNFGLERELPFNIIAKVTYVGNLGRDLDVAPYNINQPVPGPGAPGPRELLFNIAPGGRATSMPPPMGFLPTIRYKRPLKSGSLPD